MSDHVDIAEAYVKRWFCHNNEILWERGGHYKEEVEALLVLMREAEARVWEAAATHHAEQMKHYEGEDITLTMRVHIDNEVAWQRAQAAKAGGE